MSGLSDLIEWRETLLKAMSQGVLKVFFRDREVTYQTTTNMQAALRDIEARIAAAEGRPRIKIHTINKRRDW